jgi:hypothetical protein
VERESLQTRKTQIRSSAVQGLLFGSSSSVMLRLVGHGIVSEKNSAAEVRGAGAPFHRRKEVFVAAMRPRNFRRSFNLSIGTVKFKLSIGTIQSGRRLLRAALEFIIQDDRLRDFLHGFAHLLALPLDRAVGLVLADFHVALQNSLGALHNLSGFQLAG